MLVKTHNQTRLPNRYVEMTGINTQRNQHNLEDWLVGREDPPALRLDGAVENAARLCRAWLLQHSPNHPDHNAAIEMVRNCETGPVSDFLGASISSLPQTDPASPTPWHIFCPSAAAASSDPTTMSAEIETRRRLSLITPRQCRCPIQRKNSFLRPTRCCRRHWIQARCMSLLHSAGRRNSLLRDRNLSGTITPSPLMPVRRKMKSSTACRSSTKRWQRRLPWVRWRLARASTWRCRSQ